MARCAVLTNDLQYDLVEKNDERKAAVAAFTPQMQRFLAEMRTLGVPVVHLQLINLEDDPHAERYDGWLPATKGSEGARIVEEFLAEGDVVVEKNKDSGFYETELQRTPPGAGRGHGDHHRHADPDLRADHRRGRVLPRLQSDRAARRGRLRAPRGPGAGARVAGVLLRHDHAHGRARGRRSRRTACPSSAWSRSHERRGDPARPRHRRGDEPGADRGADRAAPRGGALWADGGLRGAGARHHPHRADHRLVRDRPDLLRQRGHRQARGLRHRQRPRGERRGPALPDPLAGAGGRLPAGRPRAGARLRARGRRGGARGGGGGRHQGRAGGGGGQALHQHRGRGGLRA